MHNLQSNLIIQLVASCDVILCPIYIVVCEYICNTFEFESNLSFPPLAFQLTLTVNVGMEKTSYTYSLDVEADFTGVNLGM